LGLPLQEAMGGRGHRRPQRETDKRQEKARERRRKKIRETVPREAYTAQDPPTKQESKSKKQRHLTDECKTAGRKMSPQRASKQKARSKGTIRMSDGWQHQRYDKPRGDKRRQGRRIQDKRGEERRR